MGRRGGGWGGFTRVFFGRLPMISVPCDLGVVYFRPSLRCCPVILPHGALRTPFSPHPSNPLILIKISMMMTSLFWVSTRICKPPLDITEG